MDNLGWDDQVVHPNYFRPRATGTDMLVMYITGPFVFIIKIIYKCQDVKIKLHDTNF